jgi:alpha-mannosidase
MVKRIAIVPHTHWDREWYSPFETFRLRLVETVDALLDLLESDPGYSNFLLDGQMAAVDDYLAIRPENRTRIINLSHAGRLAMGPWYTLMDEFLVSPETIIRNLEIGQMRAKEFDGAMAVGYLPDMFGHIAQMPQILSLFGFSHAVVWRGVPSTITQTGFIWEAPNGSQVRAEYLPVGYGNGARLPLQSSALIERVKNHIGEIGQMVMGDLLYMNGSDHLAPDKHLSALVKAANSEQSELDFFITSLSGYLDNAPKATQRHCGELRSGYRSNLLMGVTSNHVDVRHAQARSERALERRAEPYAALFQHPSQWPGEFLSRAWLKIVQNAAHDSVCACSVDAVVEEVLVRYGEAEQIGDGLGDRALSSLGASLKTKGAYVINPSAHPRRGVVELLVEELPSGTFQLLSERVALPQHLVFDAKTVASVLSLIEGNRIGDDGFVIDATVTTKDETMITVQLVVGANNVPGAAEVVGRARNDLYSALGAHPDAQVSFTLTQPSISRVLIYTEEVPGYGWSQAIPSSVDLPVTLTESDDDRLVIENGQLRVAIDKKTGTFSLTGIESFGRFVDGGDFGDSYNYSSPLFDEFFDTPTDVKVIVEERGPLRVKVSLTTQFTIAQRIDPLSNKRVGHSQLCVTTTVTLEAHSDDVLMTITFVNEATDHRLRCHFPLPRPSAHSVAESSFCAVERSTSAEGRPDEFGLATFPSRRFVRAGGLTLCHVGVGEYELVDLNESGVSKTLAFTLLRSTGMLSRLGMTYRPFPAGPLTPVEGLQLKGKTITWSFALTTKESDPYQLADALGNPLEIVSAPGGGTRVERGSALTLRGAQVSALRRHNGALEVRVFNPSSMPQSLEIEGRVGSVVDLHGQIVRPFSGTLDLAPNEIVTLSLDE